jgi:hypothetical protein
MGTLASDACPWFDPNPHATPCNSKQYREQKTLCLGDVSKSLQRSATTDRTLVKRLGQRFESARRLSLLPIDKPNTRQRRSCQFTPGVRLHHPYITELGSLRWHAMTSRRAEQVAKANPLGLTVWSMRLGFGRYVPAKSASASAAEQARKQSVVHSLG